MDRAREHKTVKLSVLGAGLLLGALIGGAVVYWGFEKPALKGANARLLQYERDQAAMRGHLSRAQSDAAALEGRLLVEESTRRSLEGALRVAQAELGQANDTIAFYEQLNPPGPKGAVTIRAVDIEPSGPHLRYRVLLMRSGSNGDAFQGSLQFLASGRAKGEEVRVVLQPATNPAALANAEGVPAARADELNDNREQNEARLQAIEAAGSTMDLKFTDFQRSSGLLSLPEGFIPEKVTLNVLEGEALRSSREVKLDIGR